MHSFFHISHLYALLSSLWLTWLTDPALVTSVYPNWMQYMPCVLQEVSLLDGVDASVRGNGRRCHRGWPLVGFPWFSLQPKRPRVSLFGMVPAGLKPSTGLLGLVGHLGVVSWSKG